MSLQQFKDLRIRQIAIRQIAIRENPCKSVAQVFRSLWQTNSMPSLTLGSFELSIIPDGTYPLDGGAFFGVIPKIMWSRKVHADERNYV